MKKTVASILRRIANRIDPPAAPTRIWFPPVTYSTSVSSDVELYINGHRVT